MLNGVFGVKHPISPGAEGCFGGPQHDISTVKFVKDISLKMNHAESPYICLKWYAVGCLSNRLEITWHKLGQSYRWVQSKKREVVLR
jgi:hypothetical protein